MIAVTGANGLLGSFIVRKLVESDKQAIAIVRKDSNRSLLADISDKVIFREADICDAVALEPALAGVDTLIHAAALVSFNPKDAAKIYKINTEGTRNVVDVCLETGVSKFVHISSVSALGRQKGQSLIDENNKWISSPLNSSYAESKYLAELEVFRGQEEGLNTITLNPSLILAPANWNKSSARLFKYVWQQKPFYIDGTLNYVDVRDVSDITIKMIPSQFSGERFIVNAGKIGFKEFFESIGKHFNRRPPFLKLSKTSLRILAHLEALRSKLLHTEPLITRETARLAGNNFLYDNKKITKILNFEFKNIDNTLKWCCDYYLAHVNGKN
jgi:nucleoside-diphosphate-sugar epimerase